MDRVPHNQGHFFRQTFAMAGTHDSSFVIRHSPLTNPPFATDAMRDATGEDFRGALYSLRPESRGLLEAHGPG